VDNVIKHIVIIGSGNVAYHLASAFRKKGVEIRQILGRNEQTTRKLAATFSVPYINNPSFLDKTADLYILAVQDDLIGETAHSLGLTDQLLVHTSGFGPMDLLKNASANTGVLWFLQTVTSGKEIDYQMIPVFVEGSDRKITDKLMRFASLISDRVIEADSAKRRQVHLAAVIASNLTNHLYTIASSILEKVNVPFDVLMPLILETAVKAGQQHPSLGQTGPAVRNDLKVIQKHLEMLVNEPAAKEIYRLISENILHLYKKEHEKL
jgi:predicted short-subunit dehydrogenase-like oxidoreductase (DUF2520 family)